MSEIERRFRRELREKLPKQGSITLKAAASLETAVAKRLLDRVFNGRREIITGEDGYEATTLEHELARNLDEFLENRTHERRKTLMESIPESMIQEFAAREGIHGALRASPYPDARAMIERLHAEQPQTKPSLTRSFRKLSGRATETKKKKASSERGCDSSHSSS